VSGAFSARLKVGCRLVDKGSRVLLPVITVEDAGGASGRDIAALPGPRNGKPADFRRLTRENGTKVRQMARPLSSAELKSR